MPQNVVLSWDPVTGAKVINPEVMPVIGQTTFNCPADPGGRAWQATAYSPRTGILYLPTVEFCSNTTVNPLDRARPTPVAAVRPMPAFRFRIATA